MNRDEYERMYRLEDTYWWFVARRRLAASLFAEVTYGIERPLLLDLGCGTGALLDDLAHAATVVGADFSPDALAFCRARSEASGSRHRLARADARALPFATDAFDCVTALDIIEHLDRDRDALGEIRRVLRPGGHLLATVPAFMSLWSSHDEALHHQRRYVAPQFRALVESVGLTVLKVSYVVTSLFPIVWLLRRWDRLAQRSAPAEAHIVPVSRPVNAALVALSDWEARLLRRWNLPVGLTVVLIARKDKPE
jgi:ubiquinone/menaquinone biosynthesis C-methylase UbiE